MVSAYHKEVLISVDRTYEVLHLVRVALDVEVHRSFFVLADLKGVYTSLSIEKVSSKPDVNNWLL
jgi:hypothetical protein